MTFEYPTRKVFILGAILVMLHGLRREAISEFRIRASYEKRKDSDWREDPIVRDLDACETSVRRDGLVRTANQEVLDALAHTQQTLGVSHEEWESIVKVEKLPTFESLKPKVN